MVLQPINIINNMITFSKTITNRIDWIDSLRGFAILLVIIGHLIQFNYYTSIENDIFNVEVV